MSSITFATALKAGYSKQILDLQLGSLEMQDVLPLPCMPCEFHNWRRYEQQEQRERPSPSHGSHHLSSSNAGSVPLHVVRRRDRVVSNPEFNRGGRHWLWTSQPLNSHDTLISRAQPGITLIRVGAVSPKSLGQAKPWHQIASDNSRTEKTNIRHTPSDLIAAFLSAAAPETRKFLPSLAPMDGETLQEPKE